MPDISGDDVLAEIRSRSGDFRVIMLTAVDPRMDILEMDFDDYLCKPVEKDDLVSAIDQQLQVQRYDKRLSEYLEAASKLALLEAELSAQEVDDNEQLQELSARAERLKSKMDETIEEFDDMEAAFREIGRHPG
jgi:DNA-binding response OmpR family regulator